MHYLNLVLDLDECICLRCDDGAPVEDDCCCAQAAVMGRKTKLQLCFQALFYPRLLTADRAKAKLVTGIAMGTAAVMDENAEG